MPPSSHASDFDSGSPRFSDASVSGSDWPAEPRLRGLRWRVFLGVLPPCPTTIESLRRAAANGRRRYAELRRGLIVDPHSLEDVQKGENLSVNNPLSQDPDSIWGRYFRNAELERIIESDLTRLYPEHGSFFQSYACQAMLRRILLVWALVHPQYGYRQGMHEVLAPLVYVLHLDVVHLSQVRDRYQDPFEDRFDTAHENGFSFGREGRNGVPVPLSRSLHVSNENMLSGDEDWVRRVHPIDLPLVEADDFGFNLKTMVLGSDSYGAEGELGALLSGRFVEHDAYCMFDSLMRGQGGAVVLADYFSAVSDGGRGLSPVLEASADMYHSLAAVDMSLYIHLVGLGVEPQFFSLRWLRVLFGREFDLEKLLLLWDAIFSASNSGKESTTLSGVCRSSARGSFISNFAVSMILHLRSTLLASSNATTCLQKLLNFPKNADIRLLIEHAKVLQLHSDELLKTTPSPGSRHSWISERGRGSKHKSFSHSPSFQAQIFSSKNVLQHRHSGSPEMSRASLPDSYWEERWMDSVFPKEQPSDADTSTADNTSDTTAVPESVCFPEEGRANSGLGGGTEVEDNSIGEVRPLDVARGADLSRAEGGLDTDLDANIFATPNKEALPNGDLSCAKIRGAGSNDLATEGLEEIDRREDISVEHACIRASDLSAGTQIVNCLSCWLDGAESLCSWCNDESQEGLLQRSQRQHGGGDLPVPSGKEAGECNDFENDATTKGVCKALKCKHSKACLQVLGHSMVESIQVLENALSSVCREDGLPTAYLETMESTQKRSFMAEGRLTALTALTELRKISNFLIQM